MAAGAPLDERCRIRHDLLVELVEGGSETDACSDTLVDHDCWPTGPRSVGRCRNVDVAVVAHQVQRRDVPQRVTDAAEAAVQSQDTLCKSMAARTERYQVVEIVGVQIRVVRAALVAELGEGPDMVNVVLAPGPLRYVAHAAAIAVALASHVALPGPVRPARSGVLFPPATDRAQALDSVVVEREPIRTGAQPPLGQIQLPPAECLVSVEADLAEARHSGRHLDLAAAHRGAGRTAFGIHSQRSHVHPRYGTCV